MAYFSSKVCVCSYPVLEALQVSVRDSVLQGQEDQGPKVRHSG